MPGSLPNRPPLRVEDSLIAAAKSGDQSAFAELVRLAAPYVYTLAYRLTGDKDDAEDVTQDVYLRVFKSLRKFRGDSQFTTWLYRIVANCAANALKKRVRDSHEELDDNVRHMSDERHDADPAAVAQTGALRERLVPALERLSPNLRAVVVLRDIYDLTHEDVATELGISKTASKIRLHRARRQLREQLFPALPEDWPTEAALTAAAGDLEASGG